jgi:ABC-type Co2+ transport system permease subunit
MHIEPGVLAAGKVLVANGVALALVGATATALLRRPALILRTLLAAAFFTLCMQAIHLQVGPSELHLVGAMPIYLALGAVPTLLGFALGLLLQGLLFEPADLIHLSVNTLSLALPLLALHAARGRRLGERAIDVATVLQLDGSYYAGVTLMVGFWLSIGEVATPLADWLRFAASYLAVVALEPLLTIGLLAGLSRWQRMQPGRVWAVLFEPRRVAARLS